MADNKLDILLVNDDGFEGEGIEVMFDALTAEGYNVTLVAPKEQQSGTGTSINADRIFQPTEVVNFEPNKWYVDGTPIVAALAGLDFILNGEEPDLVISGINEGANVGASTAISSGTVSAATEATRRGIPAIAVSAGSVSDEDLSEDYEIGAEFAIDLIKELESTQKLSEELLPEGVGLNINIPTEFAEGVSGIQGIAVTKLDDASNIGFSFGELPESFGEGAGLLLNAADPISPDAVTNPVSEGEQFLAGFITVTPVDGSWVANAEVRQELSQRLAVAPPAADATPLDILITNDDGFDAEGIEVLFETLTEAGHNVTLVGPKEQQSGQGTVLGVENIFQSTEVVNFETNKWYVDAPPRATTWAGLDFVLAGKKPDLVISGINEGENIGPGGAVSSGTVSAAVTALLRDVPAIAISAGVDFGENEIGNPSTSEAYQTGANFVADLIAQLQATQGTNASILPEGTGLNINIPVRFPEGINGIQGTALTESDEISPLVIDFGELPPELGGGAGLRISPFDLPANAEVSPTSEGGQFLRGFTTVTPLDGNWTASEEAFQEFQTRLSSISSVPEGTSSSDSLIGTVLDDAIDGKAGNDTIIGRKGNDTLTGGSDQDTFVIRLGDDTDTITDFGGVGTGVSPSQSVIAETDTVQFQGKGLTAKNMLLTQDDSSLIISFEGIENTEIVLQNFALENLDNLRQATGATADLSNVLFNSQTAIQDSFDVFNADWQYSQIFNRNSVTFLNDLDNTIQGFNGSDDVINGQGGNDTIDGRSGDDLLRGEAGNDTLRSGPGFDMLIGGGGQDLFVLTTGEGTDTITDFKQADDKIGLAASLDYGQLTVAQGTGSNANNTLISITDSGELLAILNGVQPSALTSSSFTVVV